ncbi:MAG: Hpt domain-containing protein [Candidatus Eremiobacteraeota bacterium]|nr:Hpt domain-containing protein [Candidatus Eremiobacteraeota bacterium]
MNLNTDKSILDLNRLLEVYEDDHEGMLELFDLMIKNNRGLLEKLESATTEHDLEGVRKASHSMKGSAGNVGATALHALAVSIEDAARDGSWDRLEHSVPLARPAFDRLRREIDLLRSD